MLARLRSLHDDNKHVLDTTMYCSTCAINRQSVSRTYRQQRGARVPRGVVAEVLAQLGVRERQALVGRHIRPLHDPPPVRPAVKVAVVQRQQPAGLEFRVKTVTYCSACRPSVLVAMDSSQACTQLQLQALRPSAAPETSKTWQS